MWPQAKTISMKGQTVKKFATALVLLAAEPYIPLEKFGLKQHGISLSPTSAAPRVWFINPN